MPSTPADTRQTPSPPDGGPGRWTGEAMSFAAACDRDALRCAGPRPPRPAAVHRLVELLRRAVFIGYFERRDVPPEHLVAHLAGLLTRIETLGTDQIGRAFRFAGDPDWERKGAEVAAGMVRAVPALRDAAHEDVHAAFDADPAAESVDETILCYPGVDAVFVHRAAHALRNMGAPLIPRMMSEIAHSRTGIDIHPGAEIGRRFFIDHGTGVVIGETAKIGDDVRMYQGVTIGARAIERDAHGRVVRGAKRHPTIGDRVTIYADTVILGGDTVVGDDCIISGAVFLTQSAPPGHIVRAKQPELTLRSNRTARS